jgi:hypothetical protein
MSAEHLARPASIHIAPIKTISFQAKNSDINMESKTNKNKRSRNKTNGISERNKRIRIVVIQ